ncbi:isoprenoid synthase domain-containing protein [Aspergillus aurantiobrunneus]
MKVSKEYRQQVIKFLHNISFTTQASPHPLPIANAAGCIIATTTYPFVPAAVQEVIAIYTTFAILIDVTTDVTTDELKGFLARLCTSQPQPNPLLRHLLQFIGEVVPRFYGAFASDMIRKAIIEFISACVVENEYLDKAVPQGTAPEFPDYIRHQTGMAEAYTFFVFPEILFAESTFMSLYLPVIPGLVQYFNLANHLLSFYKESVVGKEGSNYIWNHARANGLSPIESLRETASTLGQCAAKTKATLANKGLQNAVGNVINGYVIYHCNSSRYRLYELAIPDLEAARVPSDELMISNVIADT